MLLMISSICYCLPVARMTATTATTKMYRRKNGALRATSIYHHLCAGPTRVLAKRGAYYCIKYTRAVEYLEMWWVGGRVWLEWARLHVRRARARDAMTFKCVLYGT